MHPKGSGSHGASLFHDHTCGGGAACLSSISLRPRALGPPPTTLSLRCVARAPVPLYHRPRRRQPFPTTVRSDAHFPRAQVVRRRHKFMQGQQGVAHPQVHPSVRAAPRVRVRIDASVPLRIDAPHRFHTRSRPQHSLPSSHHRRRSSPPAAASVGNLFDVGHRDIGRLDLRQLDRARARSVICRFETNDDARKGGPELEHTCSKLLLDPSMQTPAVDLTAARERKRRNAALDFERWHLAPWDRRRTEGRGRAVELALGAILGGHFDGTSASAGRRRRWRRRWRRCRVVADALV